jgi:hypothetical protein
MESSSTENLACYEFKQHKPWFDEKCSNYWMKGRRKNAVIAESKSKKWR